MTVLAALLVLGGPGEEPGSTAPPARETAPVGAPPPAEPGAVAKLRRADEASRELGWQGTQFVARWSAGGGSSAVVDVVHVPGRGSLVRSVSAPGPAAALVPEGAASAPAAPLGLLQRHYVLRDGGEGRCAGRSADVVEAWRRDDPAGTLAARFWLDRETGLVLRREVLDPSGRTLLASAFLDLRTSVIETPPEPVLAATGRERLEPVDAEALRDEGWTVPTTLATLDLYESRAGGSGEDRLVHLAYSDGLLGVSVFAQRGELDPEALRGWERRRVGRAQVWVADTVPERVAWAAGGTVFTVLADAPGGTLDEAVRALPHDDPGALSEAASELRGRLARGLVEVAGWLGPAA